MGDPRRLRRVLGTVRDREQQVDLAAVLQDDSPAARRVEVLDREGRRSGLTARLQSQLDQWLAIVRTKALWIVLRPETGWGEMTRVGFSEPVPAVAPGISSPVDG